MEGESPKPASTPTGAVFLSYASQDAQAAQKICDALRAAGIEVWFDKSELRGGDVWDRQIREQIHNCRLFIPVISANSEARDEGYFRREWGLATDRTRDMAEKRAFLIPVVIDDTAERGASVPDKFHQIQWARLPAGLTPPDFVARVGALLGAPAPVAPADKPDPAVITAPAAHSRRGTAAWIALGLAILGIVVGGAWVALRHSDVHRHAQDGVVDQSQPATTEKSVAVLPFTDMSEKHDQEYFGDGIAEEILDRLVRVPELKVIGRTSSFAFRGKNDDLRTIGRALRATYLVEGSVRRSGDQVRVTAQLIDARDGSHLWSDTYDRSMTDILHLQDEIAARIAHFLNVTVSNRGFQRIAARSPQAYEYYLRGLQELEEEGHDAPDRARASFERAMSLDPEFVTAVVEIAEADYFTCANGVRVAVSCERALASANEAIRLDPDNPDAYAIRAETRLVANQDWEGAAADIKKAKQLGAGERTTFSDARLAYAICDMPRARQLLESIIARDPFDPFAQIDMGFFVDLRSGLYSEAETAIRNGLKVSPTFGSANFSLGEALLMQGKLDAALEAMKRERVNEGQLEGLAVVYYALGRKGDSNKALAAMEQSEAYMPSDLARVHAFRGELTRAMDYLEKARGTHDIDLFYIKGDPLVKNLEDDSRYKAFLRKMKLPE